jgi:hypothetical protein
LPLEEIVPRVDEPPAVPLTAHVTLTPAGVVVNWNVSPARIFAVFGDTEIEVGFVGVLFEFVEEDELDPPPQPQIAARTSSKVAWIARSLL